jgi:hypothetical protein
VTSGIAMICPLGHTLHPIQPYVALCSLFVSGWRWALSGTDTDLDTGVVLRFASVSTSDVPEMPGDACRTKRSTRSPARLRAGQVF